MKENILDVLLYLFENFYSDSDSSDAKQDHDSLQQSLLDAGFERETTERAMGWLESLSVGPSSNTQLLRWPVRIYTPEECDRLDIECRGLILRLEQMGVLDSQQREWVIDRAMALDVEELDVNDLKWVVLMVMFNQPGNEAACAWMQNHLFEDDAQRLQ
jgi:Smg protein